MNHSDGKEVKVALQQTATVADVDQVKEVVQQTAANVDQVKRLSSNLISPHIGSLRFF